MRGRERDGSIEVMEAKDLKAVEPSILCHQGSMEQCELFGNLALSVEGLTVHYDTPGV